MTRYLVWPILALSMLAGAGCSESRALPSGDGSALADATTSSPDLTAVAVADATAASFPDGGTFPCGPKLACKSGVEYCSSSNFGDAGMSEWLCAPLDFCAMSNDPCTCLVQAHQCFAGCKVEAGAVYYWCPR